MDISLHSKVCVVTGASRGAGKAIAIALGRCGATVYVTGRSVRGSSSTEDMPGTIEDTADEITERGGRGIAVRCDHTRDGEVDALAQRVHDGHGRVDLLVNNAWGGYEQHSGAGFVLPFWEQPLSQRWSGMFEAGLRAQLALAARLVPSMLPRKSGLIVSTTAWDRGLYLGNLFYDVAKAAVGRAAFAMATELRPHGISALALAPGFMRTERVLAAHAREPFDLARSESTAYVARAVVALCSDQAAARFSGQTVHVGDLAREYGFTDEDGRQPPAFRIDA